MALPLRLLSYVVKVLEELGKADAATDCHLASAMGLVQPVAQEEGPSSRLRRISGHSATGSLIGVQRLERQDAGVERAVLA